MSAAQPKGVGRWTRAAISSQVALAVLLAAAAALLLSWLSGRPALRGRFDLTALKTNTLDGNLTDLIAAIDGQATIEAFWTPVEPPLTQVGQEAQARMSELLMLARNQFPERLRLVEHDTTDVAKAGLRMNELGLQNETNVVVVQLGQKKKVLRLLRDIARVNPGNRELRTEPSLESFRGEEALGAALMHVALDDAPRVWFAGGHGERELENVERADALGRLAAALNADGMRVERWDSARDSAIPEDVSVVAVVDARQPWQPAELAALRTFVERGGRLLVAATNSAEALEARGTVEELLNGWGVRTLPGFVAQYVPDGFGGWRDGVPECATLAALPVKGHPVTDPLFRAEKHVLLPHARSFERGTLPKNGISVDLLVSVGRPPAWRDLPGARGAHDWRRSEEEELGAFTTAVALWFQPPALAGQDETGQDGERKVSRVVALGSPDALSNALLDSNRDFELNAFNWLAARDRRLVIRPRTEDPRRLDLQNSRAQSVVNLVAIGLLPGVCALLGVLVAWRRRN